MTGEITVVLLWVAIVGIVVVLLGGAAAAMVWDPDSRRRTRAAERGVALPLASMPPGDDRWPRRR
ncbi:hypothetical protein [Nocardia niwae]|uniref:Uncharacterized protein n=1 Tax=Nocardia niwae TaxID=626084 RepID=A0ABV2X5M3_9NOCA|nr:hypothetical protein [Nocardia niwae]